MDKTIKNLELELLKPEVRHNKKRLSELPADNFIEFASVGIILKKKDIINRLPKEEGIKWSVSNFKTIEIKKDVILATYIAKRKVLKTGEIVSSLRSSLWKNIKNNWQMIFHQGTILKK
jgi:hypothetical protein